MSTTIATPRGHVRCGDERGLWVALEPPSGIREVVTLPRPSAGVGGLELVLSPGQRYLALFVFSGQSQQGYELFSLEPQLRRLSGLAYVGGQGDAPTFSPDDRWLVMAVATNAPRVRGTGQYFEDVCDPDAEGTVVVDWAMLYIQRMPDGAVESLAVGAEIPLSTDIDVVSEWNLYDATRWQAPATLGLQMPWGEELSVPLPLTRALSLVASLPRP